MPRPNPGCKGFNVSLREEAIALYNAGALTRAEIAAQLEVSEPTLSLWIRDSGVPLRGDVTRFRQADANPLRAWAVAMAALGWQQTAIAKLVGVTRERIRQFVGAPAGGDGRPVGNVVGTCCPHCRGDLTAQGLQQMLP